MGVRIGGISERNTVLLGKWLWRFALEQSSLWTSIIRSRFWLGIEGWNSMHLLHYTHQNPWKGIYQISYLFYPRIKFSLENGSNIRFLLDLWASSQPFSSLPSYLWSFPQAGFRFLLRLKLESSS